MKRRIYIILGIFLAITAFWIFKSNSVEAINRSVDVSTKTERHVSEEAMPDSLVRPKSAEIKYDATLQVKDLNMPLLFRKNISEDLRQFILQDFNLLFEHAEEYELYDWNVKNKKRIKQVDFDGVILNTDKRIYLVRSRPPSLLHKKFGEVANVDGDDNILIFGEIVEAYEKALSFLNNHEREYEQLEDFVYMMTNATEESPITLHPRDVIYMPDAPAMKKLEGDPSLVPKAQKFYSKTTRLRMPSVLEFKKAPVMLQMKGMTLMAETYSLKEDSNIPSSEVGLVYHDGRWKILGGM